MGNMMSHEVCLYEDMPDAVEAKGGGDILWPIISKILDCNKPSAWDVATHPDEIHMYSCERFIALCNELKIETKCPPSQALRQIQAVCMSSLKLFVSQYDKNRAASEACLSDKIGWNIEWLMSQHSTPSQFPIDSLIALIEHGFNVMPRDDSAAHPGQ